jgi:D-serine deaminase-like pyridoxal phosphate-dependent protein
VASKSIRVRHLIERALAEPGYAGVLAYSLPEALWLCATGTASDLLVAYPTVDRAALRALAADETARGSVTIMVDSVDHLDVVDEALGADHPTIRVCLELDVSWRPVERVHIGTRRSPIRTASQAAEVTRRILARPGFQLVGVMAYEGQIAGLGDKPAGRPLRAATLRWIQRQSAAELIGRRTEVIAAITALTPLEFVNGGGTGSIEITTGDTSVTELAAGSGLVGPTLFDAYRRFAPEPALLFALPVVHLPAPHTATLFAGGYVASGTGTPDRLPSPYLPAGLKLIGVEGAGEVQTPVTGPAADDLRLGDRVWLRHAKAGELAERFTEYHLVSGDRVIETVPTYRGEGKAFG